MSFRPLALVLLALLTLATVHAADWTTEAPQRLNAKPGRGQQTLSLSSPDKNFTLLVRDEGEQGDFAWVNVYVQDGKNFTLLGAVNDVSKPAWKNDSVTFTATKAVESNVQQVLEIQYTPATHALKSRVLKTIHLQN